MNRKIKVSPTGSVVAPNFHDGNLVGVITRGSTLRLLVEKSGLWQMAIENIRHFRLNEVSEGNSLLDVSVLLSESEWQQALEALYPAGGSSLWKTKVLEQLRTKAACIVRIECSYGCEGWIHSESGYADITVCSLDWETILER